MVDDILIIEHKEGYLAEVNGMNEDMDIEHRGALCFDCENLYFVSNDDDLVNVEERKYMVDTKSSLQ